MAKELSLGESIYGVDTGSAGVMLSGYKPLMGCQLSSATSCYYDGNGSMGHWKGGPQQTGTTIMALQYKDGVILGADSRTSVSSTYIANRVTDKLQPIADNIFILRSGSSAHTQNVGDYVQHYLNNLSQELDEPPRVRTAAQLIQSMCYTNKEWLSASIIVAGWDKYEGGQIYSCPMGASMAKNVPFALGGSGSSYIYGFIDANYTSNALEYKDARNFVKRAISHAIYRDGSSGGVVRTISITQKGLFRQTELPFEIAQKKPADAQ
mmetsp:Transcript_50057/g.83361  ORF Transcript_50057/g.83361 Transcript_50057/m.83361 type:complete len:266 (+) Transcript_50057:54-851(+)|eukprot:CAMPEP_0202696580 /NCGR_PEP_ID=MMETSP1385-20130828/9875_1 /ASSEMBLY_ACC=CAM_ASM_000861 /TAXON_ID=933848 /ORGANISM="Elphidium margaritaceum" /LENGTH=265 /DNA_ID=CAMNT_0049352783 /DNA_START=43 /DNA_END=840 /DNA_ORIENTATION=+